MVTVVCFHRDREGQQRSCCCHGGDEDVTVEEAVVDLIRVEPR